ncbi:MAG: hypothetical protein M3R24_29985 [Chloroflexota bacterium]|nr:hypothetical protein [Chloroflexota bacterium]
MFHDADAAWQAAGIAATSWDEVTGTLYLRASHHLDPGRIQTHVTARADQGTT